jgi:hypothetical protein
MGLIPSPAKNFFIMKSSKYIREHLQNKESQSTGGSPCNPSYSGGRDQEDHGSRSD